MIRLAATRLAAILAFVPSLLLAAPVILYLDLRYGRTNTIARSLQQQAKATNRMLQPYLWAHRIICCNGDVTQQRW